MRRFLAYRDARLLLAGQSLSAFGDWAMWIVMAVWVKSLTGSSAAAGMTFFVLGLGSLAGPLGGLVADRFRRRPLMIACDCVLGTSVLVLLFVHGREGVWLIYLVALLYGAVGTVFYPAQAALLRVMLPEELLGDANGAVSSMRQGLRIVAPLAGAGLYRPSAAVSWQSSTRRPLPAPRSSCPVCASGRRSPSRPSTASSARSRPGSNTSGGPSRCGR
ncbi:MAG TPA: MFS transporter [Gaiellaceae bacterium]|nr:MFS transporter [Gaiellaceae bacterium]